MELSAAALSSTKLSECRCQRKCLVVGLWLLNLVVGTMVATAPQMEGFGVAHVHWFVRWSTETLGAGTAATYTTVRTSLEGPFTGPDRVPAPVEHRLCTKAQDEAASLAPVCSTLACSSEQHLCSSISLDGSVGHSHVQVSPEMFSQIQVWALAGPFH